MYRKLFRLLLPVTAAVTVAMAMQPEAQQIFTSPQAKDDGFRIQINDKPSLSDLLTIEKSLSLFYAYLRESTGLVERLANPLTTSTIFAPRDAAIISLSRKPHEGPPENNKDPLELSTEDDEKRSYEYLQTWIKGHIVAGTDINFEDGSVYESLAGDQAKISFSKRKDSGEGKEDWAKVLVLPGNAKIIERKEAKDGQIFVIDSCIQFDQPQ